MFTNFPRALLAHSHQMGYPCKVVTPSTAKYLIPTPIFSPCVNTAMSQNRQTCMRLIMLV